MNEFGHKSFGKPKIPKELHELLSKADIVARFKRIVGFATGGASESFSVEDATTAISNYRMMLNDLAYRQGIEAGTIQLAKHLQSILHGSGEAEDRAQAALAVLQSLLKH